MIETDLGHIIIHIVHTIIMMWNKLFSNINQDDENAETKKKVLNTIQSGWGSVLEATKHAVVATRVVVEKETTNLQQHAERLFQAKNQPYKRGVYSAV